MLLRYYFKFNEVTIMYPILPKKMLIINILDILKRYSDEEHQLSQKDILEILENEYSMKSTARLSNAT